MGKTTPMEYAYGVLTGSASLFAGMAAITSFLEKERRAGWMLLGLGIMGIMLFFLPFLLTINPISYQLPVVVLLLLFLVILFTPLKGSVQPNDFRYLKRYHEEDSVLSRRLLQPGTTAYDEYYHRYPERKIPDDKARANPGLLSENAPYYDPVIFSAAKANFTLTEQLHDLETQPVKEKRQQVDPVKVVSFIENWLTGAGAAGVGFTPLKPYHLYSHKGRGERAGEEIPFDLPHTITITVEMDYDRMKYAPAGPTVLESSEQYLRSGMLATSLALMIKELGYHARAHIDGNYEVICPLVAEDAGLGVIGRMGLLMTPKLGPRARIAVVTTDLPLEYQEKKSDPAPIHFCSRCKKCAVVCPAAAIQEGPREMMDGSSRWRISSERCYNYWTLSGTDCGRCMIACPFAHPDNWFHRFIRWGIQNNLLFRIMAVKLDDVFYGQKPPVKKLPDHLSFNKYR